MDDSLHKLSWNDKIIEMKVRSMVAQDYGQGGGQ